MDRALIIVNLGTPSSPRLYDVAKYLKEFLLDPRVIDLPMIRRYLLVLGIIIPKRLRRVASLYRSVWDEKNGSPLLHYTKKVAERAAELLGDQFYTMVAMRYGEPSITETLERLRDKELRELIILPLFPQYASATTGSIQEKVFQTVQSWKTIPQLRFIPPFFNDEHFITALIERLQEADYSSYDHLLFSYHSLPQRQLRDSDPTQRCLTEGCCERLPPYCYKAHCLATTKAVALRLKLDEKNYSVGFQSRLGRSLWITPYSDHLLGSLAKRCRSLLVVSPSFPCDCLETLDEIQREQREIFLHGGGTRFGYAPCVNDHPRFIEGVVKLVLNS